MHRPRKRFGQHFLCDQQIISQIIQALAPKPDQHLVEIGPGQGALTLPVLKIVRHLEVIEIDKDLIIELKERCKRHGDLIIHEQDVLKFDFNEIKTGEKLRVFGNLPYNISTPLLFHLLNYAGRLSDMLFMLQKEVAHRLVGKPNQEHYGRLSIMMQYHCDIDLLFNVPAFAFYPPPQVTSSIVSLRPKNKKTVTANDYHLFSQIVAAAFNQRRKTLRNSLKKFMNDSDWAHLQIHSDQRAENLSVEDYVKIANTIKK